MNKFNIWNLNILIPQVVDAVQPPTSISIMKKNEAKFPQAPKSSVVKPVPVVIETILNKDSLILWGIDSFT